MQRGSDKHGPHIDELLKREIEPLERGAPASPRVEEGRDPEAAADGEPDSDARPRRDPVETRSMIARHLHRSVFPADRDALIADATEDHAPQEVLDLLSRLPGGIAFENVQRVWEGLGGRVPERR